MSVGYYVLQPQDSYLHIIFCDVGQGDAILVSHLSTQLLIDGGKDEKVLECLEKNMPFWDKKLEVIVATHPDADHIGGLVHVFNHYSTNLIVTNGMMKETTDFDEFKKVVSRKLSAKTRHLQLHQGDAGTIGSEIYFSVLSPRVASSNNPLIIAGFPETQLWDKQSVATNISENTNDGSIVLLLEYKSTSILLTGDLEKSGELALASQGLLAEVDILKVGHHGSKTSTSPEFLQMVRPEISVISSGKNNQFGHPNPETLAALRTHSSLIYRTDEHGTLHFVSDGETIWLF